MTSSWGVPSGVMSKRKEGAPSQRQLRVGEEIRHTLAWIIERGDFRDPDLLARAITITEVRVSPDMRNATVYCVLLGGDIGPDADADADTDGVETETVIKALNRAQPFLRHQVAERMHLRTVPALVFVADASFDEAGHIDALLHSPRVARDLLAPDEDEDDTDGS